MNVHTTKNGVRIPLNELTNGHLENIIHMLEQKAISGVTVVRCGGSSPEDFYYDEDTLYGKEALKALNYEDYIKELNRRM